MAAGIPAWQTDGVSQTYLILSIVGLALTVNALRPIPWGPLFVPSFFCAWLTVELAPHNLLVHAGWNAGFVAAGALGEPIGYVALTLSAVSAAGLLKFVVDSRRVLGILEDALAEGLGDGYERRVAPDRPVHHDLRTPWRQLLNPFWMRHPDVERVRDVSYGPARQRNLLDVYRCRSRPTGAPVLLQIHGGGWAISNKNQQGKPIMLHMASRGWVCVAPNYRLSPRATWPAQIEDVKRALAWIREHVHEFGGDPSLVLVTGGSAGGHLTALAALSANDPDFQQGFEHVDTTVQGAIPLYGIYDVTDLQRSRLHRRTIKFWERFVMKKRLAAHREAFERASPMHRVREDAPPFFVVHGRNDTLAPVDDARRFAAELRHVSRAPVVYAELPGTQHAFDVFPSIRTAHVVRAVERFAELIRARHAASAALASRDH